MCLEVTLNIWFFGSDVKLVLLVGNNVICTTERIFYSTRVQVHVINVGRPRVSLLDEPLDFHTDESTCTEI